MSPDHMGDVQLRVDLYLAYYREHFPSKRIPKHHFLEDHVPRWMNRWQVGMGLHGEQDGEGIHAESNMLRRVACGVRRELDQLLVVMREHHTKCSPQIQQYTVQTVPKSKK